MNGEWTLHTGEETYYTSSILDEAGVKHLFSTRVGGVSRDCFAGWNFAVGVGKKQDDEERVMENYARAAAILGCKATDVCRTYQSHTDLVITVGENERGIGIDKPKFSFGVDGLVSGTKNLVLSVRAADCVPILLYDPVHRLCGAVHSGWRGTAAKILQNAVSEMQKHGSEPKDILAAIGPCIGGDCYEVGSDLLAAFTENDARFASFFKKESRTDGEEKYLLDLVSANEFILRESGLAEAHISSARICTHCHPELFFSHRVMGAERGTMSAFITV